MNNKVLSWNFTPYQLLTVTFIHASLCEIDSHNNYPKHGKHISFLNEYFII